MLFHQFTCSSCVVLLFMFVLPLSTSATKGPSKRNKLNLVVNTRLQAPGSSKSSSGSNDSMTVPAVQTRKASAEALFNLLSNGQVRKYRLYTFVYSGTYYLYIYQGFS